jgi:hypothetical protein
LAPNKRMQPTGATFKGRSKFVCTRRSRPQLMRGPLGTRQSSNSWQKRYRDGICSEVSMVGTIATELRCRHRECPGRRDRDHSRRPISHWARYGVSQRAPAGLDCWRHSPQLGGCHLLRRGSTRSSYHLASNCGGRCLTTHAAVGRFRSRKRWIAHPEQSPQLMRGPLGRHPEARQENHEQAIRQHWA